jgi:hypothetical protein
MFDLAEELESELYEEIDKQQRLYDQIVKPLQLRSESELVRAQDYLRLCVRGSIATSLSI